MRPVAQGRPRRSSRLEDHDGALVLAVTYRRDPAQTATAPTDERLAARPAESLALEAKATVELPEDVRGALRGLGFATAAMLTERLLSPHAGQIEADDRVTTLLGLAAVWHDDLRLADFLRQLARSEAGDWALRATGIAVAQRQGYRLLLHELCALETDPELHAELTALIAVGQKISPDKDPE